MKHIRNFSIIAHIDHGKSTLSDRIIQICGGLSDREMDTQVLDSMELERERGITIKAQSVMLDYKSMDGKTYRLNFIDTPGHVDFSYEVSRSLAACEGALLLVDAVQGVEAQTLANYYIAMEMNLKVVPVLNKIELPTADPERVIKQMEGIASIDTSNVERCSAKTGIGVINVLERLVRDIPAPKGNLHEPLQALIIDSWFDNYLGVISLICIKNGVIHKGDKIKAMSVQQIYNIDRMGIFTPKKVDCIELKCGEVGWLVYGMKDIHGAPVGDTLTSARNPASKALPGFKKLKPLVFAGLFPVNSDDYKNFHNALDKLSLNDASLFYEPENSTALGFGFRCGFFGMLHMEIIQERLEREYNLDLITTAPAVMYEIQTTNKEIIYVDNPSKLPPLNKIKEVREPIAECHLFLPKEYLGDVIALCIEKRGVQTNLVYYGNQIALTYEIPMAEVILNFFDRLKSISRGYASLDYNFKRFQASQLSCINIMINDEPVDALASIVRKNDAPRRARELVEKIKCFIPRQQFDITIKAAIGRHIFARATIKQLRKNVIAKCYGGDVSRKKKLLQKQKEGKKRMKQINNFTLSQEALLAILDIGKANK